ncbi:hypothetical protein SAMN05216588_10649 [Pseudomonas flavescens]|uniref:Uncharacterized protein n=1 Tax=Phytopseudomonas flavescens TaxID=29435 RepID=A0A1G8E2N9_9GAMM|nr:hypothetical protein SAMN05216588_10649 [Pseudomonas flavescens]
MITGGTAILIGDITLSQAEMDILGTSIARRLHLFGAVVKTGETHPAFGELKRLQLLVVESRGDSPEPIHHPLAQHDGPMYRQAEGPATYACVDMLRQGDVRYLRRPPKWKASQASIPTYQDKLLHFCTQFYIPENATTRQYLIWDTTLFVFLGVTEQEALQVQVFAQDTSEQSAEDHYALEASMTAYDEAPRDRANVARLIEAGDKHFHDYVLHHARTGRQALHLLLEHGTSKAFKARVTKKLAHLGDTP